MSARHPHRDRGFAVVELVTALLLAGLVVGAGIALLRVHGRLARRAQEAVLLAGEAGWAEAIAVRDLQLAGADPMGAGIAPLLAAATDRVVLQSDRDGDGTVDLSSAERITLAWSPRGRGRLVRRLGGQSMAIAEGVRRGGLVLRYFDADGVELAPGASGALPASALGAVCRIDLELALAAPTQDGADGEEGIALATGAALRTCRAGGGAR